MKNKPNSPHPKLTKTQKNDVSPSLIKNWSTTDPIGPFFSSCIANHEIWYCSARGLYGFDQFTGLQQHSFVTFGNKEGTVVQYVQPFEEGVLVACSDAGFYYIDLSATPPVPVHVASLKADDSVLWMEARFGSVYAYSTKNGLMRLPAKTENQPAIIGGIEKGTPPYPVLGSEGIYWAKGKQLNIYDQATLNKQHSLKLSGNGIPGIRSSCAGQVVCVVTNKEKPNKTISAISTGDKPKVLWTTSLKVSVNESSALLTDEQYCYVPLVNGSLMVLDIFTGDQAKYNGKQVGPFELGGAIQKQVLQQEGILYVAVEESATAGCVYAINLQTGIMVKMKTGLFPILLAIDNGVLYYVDQTTDQYGDLFYAIHSVRMSTLAREFYAETILMQEMEFPGQKTGVVTAPVKKARVITEITLFDESGSPRLLQHVRFGATGPAILQCQGIDYTVGPSTYADITTDANGRIRLSMKPGYTDSKGKFHDGLACPGLTMFTTFMASDLSILIRPEAQLHDVLAGVTKDTLVNGKDFNGNPVVKKEYRNNDGAMTDVAKAISTTAVMVKQSVEHKNKLLSAGGQRYLAKGCNMDTICCCADGNYHCPVLCTNNFSFDLGNSTKRNDNPAFADQLTDAQVQQWLNDHPLTTDPAPMGWDDFWDAVKSGAAAISDAIVYTAKKVQARISAIINNIEHTIDLVIDTLEKAILVAQGIFNTIAGAINKVIEMFSFLFEWQDILETKDMLKLQVSNALDTLLKPAGKGKKSLFDEMKEKGDSVFTGLKSKVDSGLKSLEDKIGNYSGKSTQDEMAKKSGMANPAQGGANANWLQAKLNEQVISSEAIQKQARLLDNSGQLSGAMFPEIKLPDSLSNEMEKLLKELQKKVTGDAKKTLEEIQSNIFGNVGDLFSSTMKFFIELLRGAVDIAIDIVQAVFDTIMILLKGLIVVLQGYITQHLPNIPFISDLYRYITITPKKPQGDVLTMLDLVCLLIAIPTQLIVKLVSPSTYNATPALSKTSDASSKVAPILSIASGVGEIIWAGFSALLGAEAMAYEAIPGTGKTTFQQVRIGITLVVGGVIRSILLALDIYANYNKPNLLVFNTLLWGISTAGLLGDVIILSYNFFDTNSSMNEKKYKIAATGVLTGAEGILALIYVALDKDSGVDLWSILFSLFGFGALLIRPGALFGTPNSRPVFIGLTSALITVAGGIKITKGVAALLPKAARHNDMTILGLNSL
ncbi:hypothetical protein AB6735_17925 [Mucilaginibacter sp. RCC_168]|uniref:hypothetical protein n=1 Tax=Mucilaginibacter sp. RCC_168 TaxID=3239221 RepID=UPI0035244ABB